MANALAKAMFGLILLSYFRGKKRRRPG